MLPEDSIALVGPVLIAGKTAWHPDYDRVVEYARTNRLFATGQVGELLRPYWESETDEDFLKLLGLYVATCDSTWREITTPFYQVGRLRDGQVERKFTYDESISEPERARRIEAVTDAVDKFYNGKPLQDYLAEHIAPTVAMTDPNAWLLTEFGTFDYRTTKARPYPVLLPSSAVVHFTRAAGTLTSMTARYVVSQDDTSEALHRFTTYLPEYAVDYWPLSGGKPTIPDGVFDGEIKDGSATIFHYKVFEHGAGQVPAYPIGYVPDQGAIGHVFWSPLHAAISWLQMELKTGHELQIVMRNMAFPRQLEYVQQCDGFPEDGGCAGGQCISPRFGDTHDLTCRKCGGTGKTIISKSSRDVITVPLSKFPEENKLKLTDYLAFVGPDSSIPEFQLKYQDWIADKLKQKLFGTTILSKTTVTQTATERLSQLDQLAIALSPFADQFSALYCYVAFLCAAFVDAGEGFEAVYDFPEDLQLKSAEDLYAQLQLAIVAGVRPDEVARIQNMIMRKAHASDPEGLRRYQVRSRFIPLLGFSNVMIIQVASLGYVTKDDVVFYFNQDRIFTDAEQAEPRFYDLGYQQQLALVQEQLKQISGALPTAATAGSAFGRLNMNPQATPTTQAVEADA